MEYVTALSENRSKSHKKWNPFDCLTLKLHSTLALPRPTKHMPKDGRVCFHRGPFAHPVRQQRCTKEPVRPLDGINKDVCGAKLHPTAFLAYCDCWCHLFFCAIYGMNIVIIHGITNYYYLQCLVFRYSEINLLTWLLTHVRYDVHLSMIQLKLKRCT